MEIPEIRKKILSYLRKDARLRCSKCNYVIIWDKKINRKYICRYLEKDKYQYICLSCYYKMLYLNYDFFSVVVIFLALIYICYFILCKLI